jgi:uncharacterized protein YbjT (DUF2867 family)
VTHRGAIPSDQRAYPYQSATYRKVRLNIVNGNRPPLLIVFRGADAFRFLTMPPQAGTQIFALASAIGASVDSSFFYATVKGELERDVREIGFRSLSILRPSIIEGERDEVRLAESLVLKLSHFFAPVVPKRFHVNPAPKIAKVLVDAVVTAEPDNLCIPSRCEPIRCVA